MKRIRLTNETVNCYGTWLLTGGGDIRQYKKNPVLLYMHNRGEVIGLLKDIEVDGDEITAEPVFDEASELSCKIKKQYEFGSINMISVGVDIIETSDDKKYIKPGQRYATVTKWKLLECSICDIGANDDAIKLYNKGEVLNLSAEGGYPALPLINNVTNKEMDLKILALALGLPETATQEDVMKRITALSSVEVECATLRRERDALTLTGITNVVESAITSKKIAVEKKKQFIELGQKIGVDELSSIIESMNPSVKVTDVMNLHGGDGHKEWTKLSEVPSDKLMELREKEPQRYAKLYEAEYGVKCEIEQ